MIDNDDMQRIKDMCDGRYRKIDDCDDITEKSEGSLDKLALAITNLEKAQIKQNTKSNIVIAILTAIATPLIPICIRILFNV